MAGKKLNRIYNEEAMLEDAKAKGLRVLEVKSIIVESGIFNDYVNSFRYLIIGKNTIGIVKNTGKVEELSTEYHSIRKNRIAWKYDDVPDTKSCVLNGGRFTFNLSASTSTRRYFSQVVGVVGDIINRCGWTRMTYNGFSINHKDCSGSFAYDADESLGNLEVVTETENVRAGLASYKLWRLGVWISFSANDTDFVDLVLSKDFELADLAENYSLSNFTYHRTLTREFVKGQGVQTMKCYKKI